MKLKDFKTALHYLEGYILSQSKGIRYQANIEAPSTFKSMLKHYNSHKYYLVYSGTTNGCIYSSNDVNVAFRALHDHMHRVYSLTFSFKDEKKLSDITALEVFQWARISNIPKAIAYNMFKIVHAEIKGQIEYYEKHRKYVDNQTTFIYDYLKVS